MKGLLLLMMGILVLGTISARAQYSIQSYIGGGANAHTGMTGVSAAPVGGNPNHAAGIARRLLRKNEKLVLLVPAAKKEVSSVKLTGFPKTKTAVKKRYILIKRHAPKGPKGGRKRR